MIRNVAYYFAGLALIGLLVVFGREVYEKVVSRFSPI